MYCELSDAFQNIEDNHVFSKNQNNDFDANIVNSINNNEFLEIEKFQNSEYFINNDHSYENINNNINNDKISGKLLNDSGIRRPEADTSGASLTGMSEKYEDVNFSGAPYFSTQGDYNVIENNNNIEDDKKIFNVENTNDQSYCGEKINRETIDYIHNENKHEGTKKRVKFRKNNDHNHNYYLKKFIVELMDKKSMDSTLTDTNVYNHIRKCGYCKKKINDNMLLKKISLNNIFNKKNTEERNRLIPKKKYSQDYDDGIEKDDDCVNSSNIESEIIILIIIGIIIILCLDLIYKIGM